MLVFDIQLKKIIFIIGEGLGNDEELPEQGQSNDGENVKPEGSKTDNNVNDPNEDEISEDDKGEEYFI